MRKLLNKPWFVAVLALAAIGAVWYSLAPYIGSPAPAPAPIAEPEPEPQAEAAAEPESPSAAIDALKQILQTKVARDPFAVASTAPSAQAAAAVEAAPPEPDIEETVRLGALWTQHGATLIFMNDRVHQVGDTIGRITLSKADATGVWLTHPHGETFLEVGKSFVLRIPARLAAKSASQSMP